MKKLILFNFGIFVFLIASPVFGKDFVYSYCDKQCRCALPTGMNETLCLNVCGAASAMSKIACTKVVLPDGNKSNFLRACEAECSKNFTSTSTLGKALKDKCFGGCHTFDITICGQ